MKHLINIELLRWESLAGYCKYLVPLGLKHTRVSLTVRTSNENAPLLVQG